MKIGALVALLVLGLDGLDNLLGGLNAWVELGLKFAGLAAAVGGAWKWLVGPGWRRLRAGVTWAIRQLELIGELGERLEKIETRLDQGHEHFERIDTAMEALSSEHALEVRAALRQSRAVRLTPEGGADRRDRY